MRPGWTQLICRLAREGDERMARLEKITPCLWFDNEAEEAARFYVSIFDDAELGAISRYGTEGVEVHGRPEGSVMTVIFRLAGQSIIALNGGPLFKFTEAVSLMVVCDSQAEIDRYWQKLGDGGDPKAQQCGWLKDRFGLSWQVVPGAMLEMMTDADSRKSGRVMKAMLPMKKLDLAALRRAYEGR
jgi:predicted 3-demethylubiquinone-9 3-methyltransferase (glyoxalase superfamily)